MAPDTTTYDSTQSTYYRTTVSADTCKYYSDAGEDIERLDNMMQAAAYHEDNRHALQGKAIHRARLAPSKHKKPHMTRRIIR